MAFSKLTKIILWVVAGISLIVVLFFYIGPKTVGDYDVMVDRVDDALAGVDITPLAPMPVIDTSLTDSIAIVENIAAVQQAEEEYLAAATAAAEARIQSSGLLFILSHCFGVLSLAKMQNS